jgi:hypothetical protein
MCTPLARPVALSIEPSVARACWPIQLNSPLTITNKASTK